MIALAIENLKPDVVYPNDILDEQGAVLVPALTPLSIELLQWMRQRNVATVYTKKDSSKSEELISETKSVLSKTQSPQSEVENKEVEETQDLYQNLNSIQKPRIKPSADWYKNNRQADRLDNRLSYFPGWDKPTGMGLAQEMASPPRARTEKYKKDLLKNYADVLKDVKRIMDKIAEGVLADADPLFIVVDRIIELFLKDKNLLLNFSLIKSKHDENLYHHSVNVCILAINIGSATGYNKNQIIEMGVGALIHDIGMVLVPPEIRYKQGKLSPEELIIIQKHPLDGLFLISKIKNLPDSTNYIIYQHHERDDGSGYPRSRKAKLMHRFARIVGLADMFDALTSNRPYRKAFEPYEAMKELLSLVKRGKVSADLMRFFIHFASLFPVGSYVRLNDGRIGRVIASKGEDFVSPMVSIIQSDNNQDNSPREVIDLSLNPHLKIQDTIPGNQIPGNSILGGF